MRRTLIIMVKEPRPGRVKTRLAADIGAVGAAWWYRHQTEQLLQRLRDPRWEIVLAVSPDRQGLLSRVWPQNVARMVQGPGDLGDRMGRLLRVFGGQTCIIGSDVPDIDRPKVAQAFHMLGARDAVLGPSEDGGYWLIGWNKRRPPPATLFKNVRWSTAHAMADTIASMPEARIGFAETLRDVDDIEDLRMTRAGVRASSAP